MSDGWLQSSNFSRRVFQVEKDGFGDRVDVGLKWKGRVEEYSEVVDL